MAAEGRDRHDDPIIKQRGPGGWSVVSQTRPDVQALVLTGRDNTATS
jgi:hypothetical protein